MTRIANILTATILLLSFGATQVEAQSSKYEYRQPLYKSDRNLYSDNNTHDRSEKHDKDAYDQDYHRRSTYNYDYRKPSTHYHSRNNGYRYDRHHYRNEPTNCRPSRRIIRTHSWHHDQYYNSRYTCYRRPVYGHSCHSLPRGYRSLSYNGRTYFYYGGSYYRHNARRSYEVICPEVGMRVPYIADDYRIIVINGLEYLKVDGVIYEEIRDRYGVIYYEVVGIER